MTRARRYVPLAVALVYAAGSMLNVRVLMTTEYLSRDPVKPLGLIAFGVSAVTSLFLVVPAVVSLHRQEVPPKPFAKRVRRALLLFGAIALFFVVPAFGFVGLANRVGVVDGPHARAHCVAKSIELRWRGDLSRRNVVSYGCTTPDGTTVYGRAEETFHLEPGDEFVVDVARRRLGAWIRLSAPEPVARK